MTGCQLIKQDSSSSSTKSLILIILTGLVSVGVGNSERRPRGGFIFQTFDIVNLSLFGAVGREYLRCVVTGTSVVAMHACVGRIIVSLGTPDSSSPHVHRAVSGLLNNECQEMIDEA
ncbi:hypothetical protein K474DRAFT_1669113 [Panus rudis PR-1116 ss-1]|nr:hypothetical protein K474DRAFT_1669113 [Panus rudis PR-1116 ss-1]